MSIPAMQGGSRREFLRHLGLSAAVLPFVCNLPSLGKQPAAERKRRLVFLFSPNGVVPSTFWPDKPGELGTLKESLSPLEPFRDRTLLLHGLCDRLRGDGDSHMRGIGCLLTGIELFPGNIQGGSHTPAGWSQGHSIDQEIKSALQKDPRTRTRFGSLEFGVLVPERADTWTRWVYAGPNKPIAPIDDPYQMFQKLYGQLENREAVVSVLDDLKEDLKRVRSLVSQQDKTLLDEHTDLVRQMERQFAVDAQDTASHPVPELEPGIKDENDNMPRISRMQIELLVASLQADFTRVATLQFTNSVGQARMRWIGVDEGHHELSHKPNHDKVAQDKLTKINKWYCQQLADLASRLAETPEPGGEGSLLDNTLLVWTNELGQGNSHTLDNIPFVLVGGGLDFRTGRAIKFPRVPHNRLLLSLAHGMGHPLESFGNPQLCSDGPLTGLA